MAPSFRPPSFRPGPIRLAGRPAGRSRIRPGDPADIDVIAVVDRSPGRLVRAGLAILTLEAGFALLIAAAAHGPAAPRGPVVRIALAPPPPIMTASPVMVATAIRPSGLPADDTGQGSDHRPVGPKPFMPTVISVPIRDEPVERPAIALTVDGTGEPLPRLRTIQDVIAETVATAMQERAPATGLPLYEAGVDLSIPASPPLDIAAFSDHPLDLTMPADGIGESLPQSAAIAVQDRMRDTTGLPLYAESIDLSIPAGSSLAIAALSDRPLDLATRVDMLAPQAAQGDVPVAGVFEPRGAPSPTADPMTVAMALGPAASPAPVDIDIPPMDAIAWAAQTERRHNELARTEAPRTVADAAVVAAESLAPEQRNPDWVAADAAALLNDPTVAAASDIDHLDDDQFAALAEASFDRAIDALLARQRWTPPAATPTAEVEIAHVDSPDMDGPPPINSKLARNLLQNPKRPEPVAVAAVDKPPPPIREGFDPIAADRKKAVFVELVAPLVEKVNARLLDRRRRIQELAPKVAANEALGPDELIDMSRLLDEFRMESWDTAELLRRADTVPPSLALAQAAEESGWGGARIAQERNSLFGQQTYVSAEENGKRVMVPKLQPFDTVSASVASYIRNLNTHPAYAEFRKRRAEARAAGGIPDGHALAVYLHRYSERGHDYTRTIRALIAGNNLTIFDRASQATTDQTAAAR